MNPALQAALTGWSRCLLEDLGEDVKIDGIAARARFACDDSTIKVTHDTVIAPGSKVTRGKKTFRVTAIAEGAFKTARIERVLAE